MPQYDVILASASPRRRELLSLLLSKYQVIPSDFDESKVSPDLSPQDYVLHSALMKARDVAKKYPDALIIGADTIVVIDDAILGKPSDSSDAARMLRMLSGRTHQVYTGVAVIHSEKELSSCECTDVTFRDLTDKVISRYVASREPLDKAGAYAIQGKGAVLITSICGCYPNVVGLPLYRLSTMLEDFGVEMLCE